MSGMELIIIKVRSVVSDNWWTVFAMFLLAIAINIFVIYVANLVVSPIGGMPP